MSPVPRLLGSRGCGSVIVECAFALAGLPLEVEEVDYEVGSATRGRLLSVNPLGQVPALILPDGTVLTESLAIVQFVQDSCSRAELIPPPGHPNRAEFYRWAIFLIAAIYPTFTYGDEPRKWVTNDAGAESLRHSTDRHREALWLQFEGAAASPWFLGEQRSALDVYLAVMTHWRPRSAWFQEHTPKLSSIAGRSSADPVLSALLGAHFPETNS